MEMPVIDGRMYLPPEDPEKPTERTVVHPETNANQVVMSDTGETLKEHLGPQMVLSAEQPERTGCIWAQITATRVG